MLAASASAHDSDIDNIAERRAGPGILIVIAADATQAPGPSLPALQVMYRDRRAWELGRRLTAKPNGKRGDGLLAPEVAEVCREVITELKVRPDQKDWEHFQVRRVVGDPKQPILLCGLGLTDSRSSRQARVLIVMAELGRRQEASLEQAQEAFRFTSREREVVQNLLKGWTNKEIANALAVSEQTVKEHIKHIMAKTRTTTRTGILMQVLRR